jgi:adenylate cyclase
MGSPTDEVFVSQGGLPSRLTQPEPSPLTRAASLQVEVTRELSELRGEMGVLAEGLQQVEALLTELRQQQVPARLTAPLGQTREVAVRVTRVNALLGEMERALASANTTVETLRQERGQLRALCVIAEHLNSTLDHTQLLERVLDDLLLLVRADRGGILLADSQGGLRFEAARSANKLSIDPSTYVMSRNVIEQVWHTQQPLLTADAQHDRRTGGNPSVRVQGICAIMCAPLRVQGKALGVVYVDTLDPKRAFTDQQIDLLAAFCNEAAIAIENANLFQVQHIKNQEIAAIKNYTDSVLASISSGVLALDNDGRVTRANHALERIIGLPASEMIGRSSEQILNRLPDRTISEKIQATAQDSDVMQTTLVHGPIAGQGRALTLSVGWAALCDPERRRLGTVLVLDDLTEIEHVRKEAQIFRRYVHPDVVDRLTRHPEGTALGGEQREISVVFADLHGFTALGEQLGPEALMNLLNDYLAIAIEAIDKYDGTITMFEGDAVMAIFNAPLDQPDHPWLAVQAAWAISRGIARYNEATRNVQKVRCGIGVHTGPALVGNIGAAGKLQNYTAIGDTVNTAKRLEEAANQSEILLSEATYRRVAPSVRAQRGPEVQGKGKSQPMRVWDLHGLA